MKPMNFFKKSSMGFALLTFINTLAYAAPVLLITASTEQVLVPLGASVSVTFSIYPMDMKMHVFCFDILPV